jgi:hypothetical protein
VTDVDTVCGMVTSLAQATEHDKAE